MPSFLQKKLTTIPELKLHHTKTALDLDEDDLLEKFGKTALQVRQEAIDAIEYGRIHDNLILYMSAGQVRSIVHEILEPVMTKAKEESDVCRALFKENSEIREVQTGILQKFKSFTARTQKFDELYSKVQKVDAELMTYQTNMAGMWT